MNIVTRIRSPRPFSSTYRNAPKTGQEKVLESEPSLDLVQESMDLFRQAAELFSAAEDPRHELVVGHMHAFLQRPEVLAVLEGKTAPPTPLLAADRGISGVGSGDKAAGEEGGEGSSNESVPRGEVLQRSSLPPLGSKGLGEEKVVADLRG